MTPFQLIGLGSLLASCALENLTARLNDRQGHSVHVELNAPLHIKQEV
jgi:hypothetical protein